MRVLNTSAESLAHRSFEKSTLFQQAGPGQAAVADPRAAASALFTQQSLNPFRGGSSSIQPGRSFENSTLFQQAGLGQAAVVDPRAAASALFTQQSLNPFRGGSSSIQPGGSFENSTLFQQAGLGQAAVADPRAAASALFTQRSLNTFGGGSSSIPPGVLLGLQDLNPVPGGSEGMLDLTSIMAERNRAALSQTYLRMLHDKATNAAATAAAAASQYRSGVQMGFTGLPRPPDESGRGPPSGRRF
jgi:hypothetical protein